MFSHFKERLEHELLAMRPFQSAFSVSIASEFHICIILLKHTALLLLSKTAFFTPTQFLQIISEQIQNGQKQTANLRK